MTEKPLEKSLEQTLKEIEERHSTKSPLLKPEETEEKKQRKIRVEIETCLPRKYHDLMTDKTDLAKGMFGKSLFITGKPGSGKTVFACSIAKEVINSGDKVKFISYPHFIMRLQDAFRNEKDSPFRMATDIARFYGLLIIDDLGAEKLTDYVRQITYFILNEREQWCLPIIITSNFSISDLDEQIDSRISSRIAGMCEIVSFKGEDRRIKKQ